VIEGMQQPLGSDRTARGRAHHEHTIAEARAKIGNAKCDAAWAEGSAMTQEQAVAYALRA